MFFIFLRLHLHIYLPTGTEELSLIIALFIFFNLFNHDSLDESKDSIMSMTQSVCFFSKWFKHDKAFVIFTINEL